MFITISLHGKRARALWDTAGKVRPIGPAMHTFALDVPTGGGGGVLDRVGSLCQS